MNGLHELAWPDVAVALDQITGLGPVQKDKDGWRWRELRLRTGDPRRIGATQADTLMRRPVQNIPAEPGMSVLRVWIENGVGELMRTPMIAWALCFDGEVRAVTPQGTNDGHTPDGEVYVLMPDGTVQSVGEWADVVSFASADEYLAHHVALQTARPAVESNPA